MNLILFVTFIGSLPFGTLLFFVTFTVGHHSTAHLHLINLSLNNTLAHQVLINFIHKVWNIRFTHSVHNFPTRGYL